MVAIVLGSCLISAQSADETNALKQLSIEELVQIEVNSVNKQPVTAFQAPAAITVLTSADIRRSGARNLPDVLRLVPGVNVAQIYSNQWAIGIRGFQGELSKAVLVLIDGRSVYTPLFAGVYWEMQDVLLEDIDRIEVIRGPGGTIWGSNAVNGVINIITKNARETRGTLVSAGGGNVAQGFVNWRYGAGTDDLSYRVYGKAFTMGPQYHFDDQNYDDWRRGQVGFRVDWRTSERDALTIQGDGYAAEAGQILAVNTYSPPERRLVQGNKLFNGQNVMLAWRRALNSGADIQIRTYYDHTDREEQYYREVRNTFDVDFIHHLPSVRHEITWGAGARVSPSHFIPLAPTIDFQPHRSTYNIFSAFLQDDIAIVPNRLSLTIGTKLEYTTYSGFNYQPSARLSWTPNRERTYWLAVTRAVRTASRIEDNFRLDGLIDPGPPPFYVRLMGDGEFSQEELIGYEAGYRQNVLGRGFIGFSLFHNQYDDLASVEVGSPFLEPEPEAPHGIIPLRFRNGVRAQTSGGELGGVWDVSNWWRIRSSYSLVRVAATRAASSNDPITTAQLEGETPQHKYLFQSNFALPGGFELDLVYRYVSQAPYYGVPSYSTGDLRLARRITESLAFEIAGRNLFQPHHIEYGAEDPMVGVRRAGYVTLTWNR